MLDLQQSQTVYSLCHSLLTGCGRSPAFAGCFYTGVKRPGIGTNLIDARWCVQLISARCSYVFMSSLLVAIVTPGRCLEHSENWHTIVGVSLRLWGLCVCVFICRLCAADVWLVFCWFVVGVRLIFGWFADDLWLVCCLFIVCVDWFVVGVPLICGWFANDLWLVCRWFVVGLPLICGWFANDLWLVCCWFVFMSLICAWCATD